ncbi:hypothetical protein ACHMW4_08625 [Mesorhizobium sp. UC22_110]|uniref:hypothetical protein n=1 Tax=unclassified Mesorhizobium TaxID=325217 RepID=UPI0036718FEA
MNKFALTLLFGTVLVTLGAVNFSLYERPAGTSPIATDDRSDPGKPRTGDKAQPVSLSSLDGFSETFERPLFNSTRRKPVPVATDEQPPLAEPLAAPAEAVPSQSPPPQLLGVSVTQTIPKALLLASGKQDASWFRNGEAIDDWTIAAITRDEVTLQRGEQSIRLSLYPPSTNAPFPETGSNAR